ncbi:MAG TPA: class I SAM-dependent methyltransferase [Rhizomicrobium sp.]|jgi:S-adenosylmethionine-diacylgycerolhomoserine-N-methlytransferase|nr:class I SAM-dependent methyltransferase [Rhizomicrobium sp.]
MTSHAALMDQVYRRQRYIYDFTRKYYLFGRDRLIRQLQLKPGARVIEIGCGTSRNLIKMAEAYPGAHLFGLDASAEMLLSSARAIERAGLGSRIKLVQAYAEDLTPALFGEQEPFDAAVFSYSLSMIPDWKQALRAAHGALAPGGKIHVVDFGDLKGLGRLGERILRGWLSLFHVAPREELLKTIEKGDARASWGSLELLAGRYAFVWTADQGDDFWTALAKAS